MRPRVEEFQNFIARLYPELGGLDGKPVRCVTLQVTDGCNLCCTYCYQTCKGHHFMDPELFTKTIREAAANVHKRLRQVEYRTQAADHPILWTGGEQASYYLKFYIFQVVDEK